jgi:glucose-6-phosphate dehydrogenase assembly protein OpcA
MEGLTPVAVAEVETTIKKRRAALHSTLERAHSHSCAMTLIVSVEDELDNRRSFNVADQLAGKHPIRVITVQLADGAGDAVRAWVCTECEATPSATVCSEEIVLQSGTGSTDRIVSAVRGLLVPDLPVFLWWQRGAPHGDVLWNGLRPMCDRIIVDSIRFGDGAAALDTLRGLVSFAAKHHMSVRDLNWQRTAPWRRAIATCFDDRKTLALLADLDRCSITYAAGSDREQPSARSLLMAGWFASRVPKLRGHCRTAAGKHWSEVAAGRVVAITLTASNSKACLMLVRKDAPGIEAQAHDRDGKQVRHWSFRAASLSEAQLLDECLETLERDSIFESALEI